MNKYNNYKCNIILDNQCISNHYSLNINIFQHIRIQIIINGNIINNFKNHHNNIINNLDFINNINNRFQNFHKEISVKYLVKKNKN